LRESSAQLAAVAKSDRHDLILLAGLDARRKFENLATAAPQANHVSILDTEPLGSGGSDARVVVPCHLGDWVGKFVQPRVVCIPAIEHGDGGVKHESESARVR